MWIDDVGSVAVVGASSDATKVGGKPLDYLLRYGFEGEIYPVNPTKESIRGLRSYSSLSAVPVAPDLVIIAVPASMVLDVVEQAARIGAGHVVIFSSGFGELSGEGRDLEQRIAELVVGTRTRVLGPNCQGFVSPRHGLYATFSSVYAEAPACDGDIAVLSQSGAVAAMVYSTLQEMGRGIRLLCATGNEVDLDVFEVAHDLVSSDCKVVALYAEQVRDAARALEAVRSLIVAGKRVVVLRAGKSTAGRRAAASHTGSMTTDDAIVLQAFAEAGAVLVSDVQELGVAAALCEQPAPAGRRVAIVSNSGGLGVTLVDQLDALGFSSPAPTEQTRNRLARSLPEFVVPGNPADLSTHIMTDPPSIGQTIETLSLSGEYETVVIALGMVSTDYDRALILDSIAAAAKRSPHVLVATVWVGVDPVLIEGAGKRGLFAASGARLAIQAISSVVSSVERSDARCGGVSRPVKLPWDAAAAPVAHNEFESKMFLSSVLGTESETQLILSRASLVDSNIAFPAVLKICDNEILHKSDGGFVELGISSTTDAIIAFDRMHAEFSEKYSRVPWGFILEPMASTGFEVFIGITRNEGIGYSLIVGAGGVDVEAIDDTVCLLPPLTARYVRRQLEDLRCWPILVGGRSGPYDVEALISTIVAIDLDALAKAGVVEVDVNPIIVHRGTGGSTIVDSTVLTDASESSTLMSLMVAQAARIEDVK